MTAPPATRRLADPVAWMRRVCKALPGVVEVEAWGHPTFRFSGRTFAAVEIYKRRPCVAISAEPDEQEVLIRQFGFFKSPYVGNRGWVSIWVDEPAPAGIMRDLVKRAYRRLARSKSQSSMSQVFRFPSSMKRDPCIETWMREHSGELGAIAQRWFGVMRDCGDDVREVLHDGHPTACVGDTAFAYVNAFRAHVNVGFFHGAALTDPARLLQGTGKRMRHVKVRPGHALERSSLEALITAAYRDILARLKASD